MPRPATAIGFDIGGRTIQLVALAPGKTGPQLVAALARELDPNRIYTRDELASQIRSLIEAANVSGPSVLAIGDPVATVQMLTFPKSSEAQLHRMVEIETQRLAGLSPEEMVHDFIVISNGSQGDSKVLVGLCRASAIHEQLTLAKQAGIEAEDVTISTIALFNAFVFAGETKQGAVSAFIEIGRDATNLAVESGGALQFVRSFPNAGNSFTTAVAESEQLNFAEAERWKVTQGEVYEVTPPEDPFARRQMALHRAAENWLNELNKTLAYFLGAHAAGTPQIDRFVFCGGGAQLRGLIAFAEKRLGKPVKLGQPLQIFQTIPPVNGLPEGITQAELTDPRFAISLGLALQGLGEAAEPLSLLPANVRAERISSVEGKKWVIASALAAGVALTATLWAVTDFWLQGRRLEDQKATLKRKESLHLAIETEKAKRQLSEILIAPILFTGSRGPVYVDVLRALAQTKPSDDWLSLVADAESYNRIRKQDANSTQVPRLPDSKPLTPAAASNKQEEPLKTLIVEGYTQSPNLKTVKDYIQRLEAYRIGNRPFFKHVDTLAVDRRIPDPEKDKLWEPYHMTQFTLELILADSDSNIGLTVASPPEGSPSGSVRAKPAGGPKNSSVKPIHRLLGGE